MAPPRKRESELQRPRARQGEARTDAVSQGQMREVTIPRVDPNWSPRAKRLFNSLKTSGQADYFQDSDWAFAMLLMDQIPQNGQMSAMLLASVLEGLGRLMMTETDRRKARIELQRPEEPQEEASVTAINDYKARLAAGG